jgi:hypothetical protein
MKQRRIILPQFLPEDFALEHWYLTTRLRGVTSNNTTILLQKFRPFATRPYPPPFHALLEYIVAREWILEVTVLCVANESN